MAPAVVWRGRPRPRKNPQSATSRRISRISHGRQTRARSRKLNCPLSQMPATRNAAPPLAPSPGHRIQAARTRRKHHARRSGAAHDFSGQQSLRRPAGDGARNRQSRDRSSVLDQRRRERGSRQAGREDQSWPSYFHAGRRSRAASRSAPSTPQSSTSPDSMEPVSLFRRPSRPKAKPKNKRFRPINRNRFFPASPCRRNSKRWRAPSTVDPVPAAPHVRRLAREIGIDIHDVKGTGPGGRISENDVKAHSKSLLACSCRRRADAARRSIRAAGIA